MIAAEGTTRVGLGASGSGGGGLAAAAGRRWDAVVIGAGPAGAAAALGLARGGLAVLLLERADWPRAKVCGGCLNAAGLAALERMGARRALASANDGPRLDRLELAAGGRRAAVPLTPGRAIERSRFDAALVADAVDAGATFLPATTAARPEAGTVTLRRRASRGGDDSSHATIRATITQAGLIIDAAGLGGTGAINDPPARGSRIGIGAIVDDPADRWRPGVIHMACGSAGYVGATRLADGRLNLAATLRPTAARAAGGLGPALHAIYDQAGAAPPASLHETQWRGTPALTRCLRRPWAERLLTIGDAAGYVEPFTGEGLGWALAGGAALAERIRAHAGPWSPTLGAAWAADHRRLLRRRHRRCHAVARLLRRPTLTRLAVAALHHRPDLAQPVIDAINRPMLDPAGSTFAPQAKGRP